MFRTHMVVLQGNLIATLYIVSVLLVFVSFNMLLFFVDRNAQEQRQRISILG